MSCLFSRPSEQALLKASVGALWPRRDEDSRLNENCAPIFRAKFQIDRSARFFTIGSCFARNIEEYLMRSGIPVLSRELNFPDQELNSHSRPNDLLVKYTPASILNELEQLQVGGKEDDEVFISHDGRNFHDIFLPMYFPSVGLDRARERRKQVISCFATIAQADTVVLTLGLIEDWYDRKTGTYMNGPPPLRTALRIPDRFEFRVLTYDENLAAVQRIVSMMRAMNGGLKIVLTVSPVPLARTFTDRDVISANMFSKSMLRTIAQTIADQESFVDYFPSYEMVTLSDPNRAWQDDGRHVRDGKVGEVMTLFFESYLGPGPNEEESPQDLYIQGQIAFNDKQFAIARDRFLRIEQAYRNDEKFMRGFFRVAVHCEDADLASRLLETIDETFPRAANVMMKARLANMRGDFDLAIALATPCLKNECLERQARQIIGNSRRSRKTLKENAEPAT